jgi:iron complex outermembrane recepter protein
MLRATALVLVGFGATAAAGAAQERPVPPTQPPPRATVSQDLKRLSIEELAELDVTSVSRRVERLAHTAAAVSVIRQEDIRRSSVTTLAEAMRLADAVDVARSDGRTWNITARGFNIVTANKLLVLMDGRTLYSPLFAGTFWDVQDTALSDVDRIEVIRGPGGTIWGANAVNGVINIITKDASLTRGNHAVVSAGAESDVVTTLRHGGDFGAGGHYRIYGKYRRQGANRFSTGESADDPLQLGQLGFRLDSNAQRQTRWMLQGKMYIGTEGLFDRDDTDVNGGFLQARWSRQLTTGSEFAVRTYYDRTYRKVPLQFEEGRDTVDVDIQHHMVIGTRHDIVGGGQVRVTTARAQGSAGFFFEPERRTNGVGGLFVQDEITLRPARLFLTLGSKFEGNDYTGVEAQPTARIRWSRDERQTVWGAVSRAVRLPTRFDTDLRLRNPATGALFLSGSDDFESESVVAYEAGYRVRAFNRLLVDVAAFANRYNNLRSQELPSRLGPVIALANTLNAWTSGTEVGTTVLPIERWRIHGAFSWLHKEFSRDPGSHDISSGVAEGNDPTYQYSLRSYLDLPRGFAFDGVFRHVANRPAPALAAYSSLDLRLAWAARPGWELSLVGQKLLHRSHQEFVTGPRQYEFERGLFARSIWFF